MDDPVLNKGHHDPDGYSGYHYYDNNYNSSEYGSFLNIRFGHDSVT